MKILLLEDDFVYRESVSEYLESLGYTIHERNWRYGHLEIDIIAQWGGTLVIAEVKTSRFRTSADTR